MIFLPTSSVDEDRFISDILSLSNLANRPRLSLAFIFGTPKAKLVLILEEFNAPLHIPLIEGTAERVTLKPSPDTDSMRLNLSTVSPSGVYLSIVPVLTPTKL